jgi:hypothetical protein
MSESCKPCRRPSSGRQFLVLLLFGLGAQGWILLGRAQLGERRQLIAAVLVLVAAIVILTVRPLRNICCNLSKPFGQSSPRTQWLTAGAIAVVSCLYLYATARFQHRDLNPILHDEYAYLIQSNMLASGHLWLPRHEQADFFDTFHLITDRAYASKYGPGTAIACAPAALLHLPPWLTPLLLSGLAVGLIYLLATELFDDPSAGWLAALLLLSLGIFRRTSVMVMSQAPMLALLILAMLAYVRWRRTHRPAWILTLGLSIGLGAITRPVDALCVALPIALAILLDLRHLDNRARIRTILLGLAAVAPFLLLQAVYNKGVTGSFTTLPWDYDARRNDPYDTMSTRPFDPALRPLSTLSQKQAFHDEFVVPAYKQKLARSRGQRLLERAAWLLAGPPLEEQDRARLIYGALPNPLLIALLPVGLLGLCHRRWVATFALPPFLLVYANYTFFFPHYAVAMAPAVILLALAARSVLRETWPAAAGAINVTATLLLIALALTALPELNRSRRDQWFDAPLLRQVDRDLAAIDKRPALVLFTFDPERPLHEEPVYNTATAWPDDAPVIRAHDLGDARNADLIRYYAARWPGLAIYRYLEADAAAGKALRYLGAARELAR